MSIPVHLADLEKQIEQFDPTAYIVTVNEDGSPHVVAAQVRWDDKGRLRAVLGNRSTTNATRSSTVTLLWPASPAADYALIVDGDAASAPGPEPELVVTPTAAVLHRTPLGDPDSPSCIRVLERS
jgi:hypothetical protein